MDYNYHTHTYRCRHAKDKDEEYVLRAIDGGIKHMGFSDHAPFVFKEGEADYRIPVDEVEGYFSSLSALREKYRDKISIKIGLEMEYYPALFDKMLEFAKKCGAEYLLLGQHQLASTTLAEDKLGATPSVTPTENADDLKLYVNSVISAMQSGAFSYVCHPDIIRFVGDADVYREEMMKMCLESKRLGIPLEINFLGIRTGRHYPREEFWKIAGEAGSPVTFGFDAHTAKDAYDPLSLEKAMALSEKYSLNYIGEPNIIPING